MAEIDVDGMSALVDDVDFAHLSQFTWHLQHGYAARKVRVAAGKYTTRYMHQEILPVAKGRCVDHFNFNRLDNRRENLSDVTHARNLIHRERTIREEFSSKYRGVAFHRECNDGARFIVQYKNSYLGVVRDEESGARMYDLAALMDRGLEAQLNFPIQSSASNGGGL